jgi:hypothetical protein
MTVWAFAKPRHIRRKVIHCDIDEWKVFMVFNMSLGRDKSSKRKEKLR